MPPHFLVANMAAASAGVASTVIAQQRERITVTLEVQLFGPESLHGFDPRCANGRQHARRDCGEQQAADHDGKDYRIERAGSIQDGANQRACRQAHDEWKIVPWGMPEHRCVPPNATMANSVQMRLDGVADYRPENVNLNGSQLAGYSIAQVLPYRPPEGLPPGV